MRIIALFIILAAISSCSRHDVGDETNNPAPTSSLSLVEARQMGVAWVSLDVDNHSWGIPTPTSSMVPYMDSHSVVLLEHPKSPIKIHDIVGIDEGPGRENICHQVIDIRNNSAYIDGKNDKWPDGWYALDNIKWRVASIIYTKG